MNTHNDQGLTLGSGEDGLTFDISRKQKKFSGYGGLQTLVIERNTKTVFTVHKGCKGIYFNILYYADESKGWALNHYIHKGRNQHVRGQPYKLR
jgi:hypothetical protein